MSGSGDGLPGAARQLLQWIVGDEAELLGQAGGRLVLGTLSRRFEPHDLRHMDGSLPCGQPAFWSASLAVDKLGQRS